MIYRAEEDGCRRFPGPASGDLRGGPRRNFQVFTALDFLAELTQHIPEKGEHLVRYYGWYSHRQRGVRARTGSGSFSDRPSAEPPDTDAVGQKTCLTPSPGGGGDDSEAETMPIDRSAVTAQKSTLAGPRAGSVSTWAMLIQRVYEVNPLECPHCGGPMKVVRFIERGQQDVIERILRHCGRWEGPLRTLANPRASPRGSPSDAVGEPNGPGELHLVLDDEFEGAQTSEAPAQPPYELQLVLDPEYL